MNEVKIEINLNPLTDGIVQSTCADEAERQERHALVIATNGDMEADQSAGSKSDS